jgi:hypothetical protein
LHAVLHRVEDFGYYFYMGECKRLQGSHIWVAENHKPDFFTHEAALRGVLRRSTTHNFFVKLLLSFQISADDAGTSKVFRFVMSKDRIVIFSLFKTTFS